MKNYSYLKPIQPREIKIENPLKKLSLRSIILISLLIGFLAGMFFQATFVRPPIVNLCGNLPSVENLVK